MERAMKHYDPQLTPLPYERGMGILLPLFSLPSPYGIGTLGKAAFDFIDYLKASGIRYWQILPLGPTAFGNSPYSSLSSYGGNPYFIDLDLLKEWGLLTKEELHSLPAGDPEKVDYDLLKRTRAQILQRAFLRFEEIKQKSPKLSEEYKDFIQKNKAWLEGFCLFMAIKESQEERSWIHWPRDLKNRKEEALEDFKSSHKKDLNYQAFLQFIFYRQWWALKDYAHKKDVFFIGDLPLYVAMDSADVWLHPELFQLDAEGNAHFVAGAPPDPYNDQGQKWGNPLYNWSKIREENYKFWIDRAGFSLKLFDFLRLDHFLGFEHYWKIPIEDSDASRGSWEKGPGLEIFQVLEKALGPLPFIAEDLGAIDEKVIQLREKTAFPGLCPLEFAFSSKDSPYLPHNHKKRSVAYSSTHDSMTLKGWWDYQDPWMRESIREYFHIGEKDDAPKAMIQALAFSRADLCIFSMQDILFLGNEARMNIPGTIGGNWIWRMSPAYRDHAWQEELRKLSKESVRLNGR